MINITKLPLGREWNTCFEGAWLQEYFTALKNEMGPGFDRWHFHVLLHNKAIKPITFANYGKGHVLIWLSDESSSSGADAASTFEHVFKSYALPEDPPQNVHSFPLFGSAAVLNESGNPFDQRINKVFFSGNLNRNRSELYWRFMFPSLDNVPLHFPSILLHRFSAMLAKASSRFIHPKKIPAGYHIRFNPGFRTGLSEAEYAHQLANTMICLCPPGFITSETIRHFEAMRMGCVIVSKKLPSSCYYNGSPIIQVEDWQGILGLLRTLLQDSARLREVSEATSAWWRERCSPISAALETSKFLQPS